MWIQVLVSGVILLWALLSSSTTQADEVMPTAVSMHDLQNGLRLNPAQSDLALSLGNTAKAAIATSHTFAEKQYYTHIAVDAYGRYTRLSHQQVTAAPALLGLYSAMNRAPNVCQYVAAAYNLGQAELTFAPLDRPIDLFNNGKPITAFHEGNRFQDILLRQAASGYAPDILFVAHMSGVNILPFRGKNYLVTGKADWSAQTFFEPVNVYGIDADFTVHAVCDFPWRWKATLTIDHDPQLCTRVESGQIFTALPTHIDAVAPAEPLSPPFTQGQAFDDTESSETVFSPPLALNINGQIRTVAALFYDAGGRHECSDDLITLLDHDGQVSGDSLNMSFLHAEDELKSGCSGSIYPVMINRKLYFEIDQADIFRANNAGYEQQPRNYSSRRLLEIYQDHVETVCQVDHALSYRPRMRQTRR